MSADAAHVAAMPRRRATAEGWWAFSAAPLVTAAVAFAWMLYGQLRRVYGMTSDAWDLGYYQQLVWSISQGHGFYSSFARANSLGIHLEPILVVPAAVERFWPSPVVLLLFSSAALAATAPAAYMFFRAVLPAERVESPWLAVALSAPIPFWAATQEAARDFFHPENIALPLALLAAWAGVRGHRAATWTLCVLALACNENQAYTVAVIAVLLYLYGAPVIKGQAPFILLLGGGWFLIGTGIVQQQFRDFGATVASYGWLAGADPMAIWSALLRPEALLATGVIVASMFALPVLAPRWLLLVLPTYVAGALSDHASDNTLSLHHVLPLLFPLIVAGGIGARKLVEMRWLRPAVALVAVLPAVLLGWGTGRFPPALGSQPVLYSQPLAVAQLRTATSMIPSDARVNADPGLTVWLANRQAIGQFPDTLDANSYVVIDMDSSLSAGTDSGVRQKAADALQANGRSLVYDDGRFQVWSPVGD